MEHSQFEDDRQEHYGGDMGGMDGMDDMSGHHDQEDDGTGMDDMSGHHDQEDDGTGMDDMSGHHDREDDGTGMDGKDGMGSMNGHHSEEGHGLMNNQSSSQDLGVQSVDKGHTCWPHPAKAQEDFETLQQQLSEATHLHPAAVEHLHILVQEIQEEFEKYQDMHDDENGDDGPSQHGSMHTQCHRLKDAIHQYMILDSENEGAKNLYADFAGAAHGEFKGHEGWDPSDHMRRRPKWTDPLFYDDPDSDDEDGEGSDHYGHGEDEGEDAADGGDEDGEGGDHYGNGEGEGEYAADGGDNEPQWSGNQAQDTADDDEEGKQHWPGNEGDYDAPGSQPGEGYGDWPHGGEDDYGGHEPEQSGHHHYGQEHNPGEGQGENDDDRPYPYPYPTGDHDDDSGYTTGHDPSHVMERMTATLSLQNVGAGGGGYDGAGSGDQGYGGGQDMSESWPPEHDGRAGPSAYQGYHHGTHQGGGYPAY